MTLVPAGCRSPGRCCGNHSHQPDGISVGEHEKDGSGSVLPGPARPKKQLRANTVPGERERESRACRKTLQSSVIRNACSGGNTVVVVFPVSHILWPLITRTHAKKKEDLQGYHQSRPKRLFI